MKGGYARRLMLYAGSSWARIIAVFFVSFFLTPILIGELGVDLFGLLSLVALTLALSEPVRAAVSKVLTREMTQAISSGSETRFREVFSNGVAMASIGFFVLLALTALIAWVGPILLQLSPENVFRARVALAIEGSVFAFMLLTAPANNLYISMHRVVLENAHRSLTRLLDLIAALIVFAIDLGDPFIAFVIGRAVLRVAQIIGKCWWILARQPWAGVDRSLVSIEKMRELMGIGLWSGGTQIARIGYVTSDQILLNLFFGLAYNGLYAVVNQLRAYARMFGGNIALGVDAVAADLDEQGEEERGRRLLVATMKMTLSVTLFCALLIAVFTPPLIDVWLGDRLREDENLLNVMSYDEAIGLAWSFILILLPSVVLVETSTVATQNLYGMGHIRRYSPILIVGSIIKIIAATLWLILGGGPLSVAWATLAVTVVIYGVLFPRLICRLSGVTARDLVFGVYARPLLATALIAAVAIFQASRFEEWTWTTLIFSVAVSCAAYAATFPLVVATPLERRSIFKVLSGASRRVLRRKVVRP